MPAFVGLGAPYWDADCRGALYGLTRNTGPNELAKAALDAVCFQTADLLDAMHGDWPAAAETVLRVDGGMAASDWTMQRLADILDAPVDRPTVLETTALGAAYLAGLQSGFYPEPDQFAQALGARPPLHAGPRRRPRARPRSPPGTMPCAARCQRLSVTRAEPGPRNVSSADDRCAAAHSRVSYKLAETVRCGSAQRDPLQR